MRVSRQFYFLKDESKNFGIGKLATVSLYTPTFTNLLNPTKKTVLNAHKKNRRRRKSLIWSFVFFVLFMLFMRIKIVWVKVNHLHFVLFVLFVLFVCVKSFRVKNKTALIPSFILLLMSALFHKQHDKKTMKYTKNSSSWRT